jgi:hypothetical protein
MTSRLLGIVLFLMMCIFPKMALAQSVYGAIDWKMAAIISANDYNNGSATGDPGLTLGMGLGSVALELSFVKYTFEGETENNLGLTQVFIEDMQLGIGARLQMNPFIFSKIGLLYHQIETSSTNSNNNQLIFGHDGGSMGVVIGGGLEIPFSNRFSFQSSLNLETANSEISMLSVYLGIKTMIYEF